MSCLKPFLIFISAVNVLNCCFVENKANIDFNYQEENPCPLSCSIRSSRRDERMARNNIHISEQEDQREQ